MASLAQRATLAVAAAIAASSFLPGAAAFADPPGNNGTVKIATLGDLDRIPNNTPHQSCTFTVQWYGYDKGPDVVSHVSFTAQAPTAGVAMTVTGPSTVFVGGDPASGAGTATGLDGTATYTLSFAGAPPAKQGYHVRLVVATPHSLGNDTKSKMFWVSPCPAPSAGSSPQSQVSAAPFAAGTIVPLTPVPHFKAKQVRTPTAVDSGERARPPFWAGSRWGAAGLAGLGGLLLGAAGLVGLLGRVGRGGGV